MHGESLHNLLLCVHLVGVFILLMGVGLIMTTLVSLRQARTTAQLRQALFVGRYIPKFMPVGVVLILFGGVWMALMKDTDYTWHSAWIITAFVLVLSFASAGKLFIGKKLAHIAAAAAKLSADGPLNNKLLTICNDPVFHNGAWMMLGVVFSFIVLMIEKPGWLGSIATVVSGAVVGLIVNTIVATIVTTSAKTKVTTR